MTTLPPRDARADDAAALAALDNRLIAGTTVTFRTAPTSAADRADWIAARQEAGFPVLVAETGDGRLAGYASYGPFRSAPGYALTVEHSIHLDEEARGAGLGRALMTALQARARAQGLHAMVGVLSAENEASRGFHRALGFTPAALLPEVGHKFGRWLGIEFWVLLLDDRPAPPGAAVVGGEGLEPPTSSV